MRVRSNKHRINKGNAHKRAHNQAMTTAENYLVPLGVVRIECALDWNRAREGDTTIDQQQPHISRGIAGIPFHRNKSSSSTVPSQHSIQ